MRLKLTAVKFRSVLALLAAALVLCAYNSPGALGSQDAPALEAQASKKEKAHAGSVFGGRDR